MKITKIITMVAGSLAIAGSIAAPSFADGFASFKQHNTSTQAFQFTSPGNFTASTLVDFSFATDVRSSSSSPTIPANSIILASLNLTGTQNAPIETLGGFFVLPVNVTNLTLTANGHTLLSLVGDGAISGQLNGTSGGASGSQGAGNTVTFASDYLDFTNSAGRSFSFSLDNVTPGFTKSGSSLSPFSAIIGATFAATPTPTARFATPEPSSVAGMAFGAFGIMGMVVLRRNRRANSAA